MCRARADYPGGGDTLHLETFVRLPHALSSLRGEGTVAVDRLLGEQGRSRRTALRIRSFLAAPFVVARSELVLSAPRTRAKALDGLAPLRVPSPPLL